MSAGTIAQPPAIEIRSLTLPDVKGAIRRARRRLPRPSGRAVLLMALGAWIVALDTWHLLAYGTPHDVPWIGQGLALFCEGWWTWRRGPLHPHRLACFAANLGCYLAGLALLIGGA